MFLKKLMLFVFIAVVVLCCLIIYFFFTNKKQSNPVYLYQKALKRTFFSKKFKNGLIIDKLEHLNEKDYKKYNNLKIIFDTLPTDYYKNYNIVKLERKLFLRKTIDSSYDREIKMFIVHEMLFNCKRTYYFTNFENYYYFLNKKLKDANLTEYLFENQNISKYNLDGAYLCSKILIELGKYNGDFFDKSILCFFDKNSETLDFNKETNVSVASSLLEITNKKTNDDDRRIYYITDIHLIHRIKKAFPQSATYHEIKFFIQKYIHSMLKNTSNKKEDDYLLIGGDVSPVFEISKIFYEELSRCWNPSTVVAILGNHELWGSDLIVPSKRLEYIVEQYRRLFNELGIVFLHNSLLIRKNIVKNGDLFFENHCIITEQELMNKSIEDLHSDVERSDLILFGGVGFSGYNKNFNAKNGIYRETITSLDEDLKYTQKTENVYNKLVSAFPLDKLVVFSHMPISNWSKLDYHPNWIYISGHTHHNLYKLMDHYEVYADNQIGYHTESVGLKFFLINKSYDIFRFYPDGIFKITKEEYITFNYGMRIRPTFNREVDCIIMLKKQGIYLFLIEKSSLFLLNGGQFIRLKQSDVMYYYENMVKYYNYIEKLIGPYNEALKRISKIIKAIGGDGKIHGSIVDIDFLHHIFLNPQNGTINPYYSPRFGERYEYPSIEALLQEKLPHIYANYQQLLEKGGDNAIVASNGIDLTGCSHIFDIEQYQPSNFIKQLQYATEYKVIRYWNDDFLLNQKLYLSNNDQDFLNKESQLLR